MPRRTIGAGVIDVVIPVYNAPVDLARCVESVLAHTTCPYRLVLIDDASLDQAIPQFFAELDCRALPHILLLRNDENLGFTGTANRGMRLSRADVVLLNSDTIVTDGWLDAFARCAASDPRIGTATPFSNNAEICSYPRFCENAVWPEDRDPGPVRSALAHAAVPTYPDLPTGVGFCMFVRRALIDAIGIFDPAFGKGYGEENEFCMRAVKAGFRNVLCDDAFVVHTGARSFLDAKTVLGPRNLAILLERHPHYLDLVHGYIAADPLRPIRDAALARQRVLDDPAPGVLHVIHGQGGGTEHHARALIQASRSRYRHYLAIAVGERWQIEEHLGGGPMRAYDFRREADEPWPEFVGGLCATFGIGLLHLHNVSGSRDGILAALAALPIPYGYTIHDLNFACPTITFIGADDAYCGGQTDAAVCGRCLDAQPEFAGIDIVGWRERHRALLARAAFLVAPSHWTANELGRYFPALRVDVIPHGAQCARALPGAPTGAAAASSHPTRMAVVIPDDDVPTVAVLGAIGPDKGARRLDAMVDMARARGLRLRFVLIGYLDRLQAAWQSDDALFTIHGRYESCDLKDLLAHYRVRLVAFPSVGPETFSLTLSEAWAAGRPVLVPPIGALAERVGGAGGGWVLAHDEWRDDARMLERIAALVAPEHASALAAAAQRAREISQPELATMAQRTLDLYGRALASRAAASGECKPLAPVRVRDALGYVPWFATVPERVVVAPAEPAPAPAAPLPVPDAADAAPARADGALGTLAKLALQLRPTLAGRILHRLTPARVLDALKARLP